MWTLSQRHGSDVISGIIAHEIGHHIVETSIVNLGDVSNWHHEFCADYISGIIGEFHGVEHSQIEKMYADTSFAPPSLTHPNGGLRAEAYNLGVEWAQNHTNAEFADCLLKCDTVLSRIFVTDIISKFPGSYNEYVNF